MTIWILLLQIAAIALGITLLVSFLLRKPENIMDWIYTYLRNFLGTFFIYSGIVKAIDPKGTAIKNGDYFSVFSEYVPLLDPLWNFANEMALPIATIIIIIEILIGITLILGIFKKPTLWAYIGLIVFFTFLTGFTAYTGKVTDCGCFGDFLKLEPFTSFLKDIFLSAVLLIIVLGAKQYLKPVLKGNIALPLFLGLALITTWFSIRNINHLPIKDFRAYKIGTDLRECTSMEGLDPGLKEIYYQMVNSSTGEKKEMESKVYMDSRIWEDKNWKIEGDPREVVIRKAELPKCKDFIVIDGNDDEIQEDIKAENGYFFFVGAYDVDKASAKGFETVNQVMKNAAQSGIPIYGLTASNIPTANEMAKGAFKFNNLDAVPIKTMIRANPGVVLVKDAKIVDKWHYNDLPDYKEIVIEHGI